MKDLGTVRKDDMYPTMAVQENKIDYPMVSLPRFLFTEEKLAVNDIVELKIRIKVKGLVENEHRNEADVEIIEGEEIKETPKETPVK